MLQKETKRIKRHRSIRKKVSGTAERPRLSVHRSANHLYVQVIDDIKETTLASISTMDKSFSKEAKGKKSEKSAALGKVFAETIKKKGIQQVTFDRGGYKFHGRIKALAESLREAGIKF